MFVSTAFRQEQSYIVTMATKMLQPLKKAFFCIPPVPNCMQNLKGSWKFSFPKLFDSYRDSILTAIVCNFRTFVGLFIFVIRYGSNHEMDIKRFQFFFACQKNGKVHLVCPYLPANMADRRWSFEFNSSPILKISQDLVIFVKRSSLPLNIYFKKHGKCLVLTIYDLDVLRSL